MTSKLYPIFITGDVADAINQELQYQASLQESGRADSVDYGVPGQVVTLVEYTNEVVHRWTREPGQEGALDSLRKVAAIAVRALVEHGCPRRNNDKRNSKTHPASSEA